jgi:hypothetical protein
MKTYLKQTSNLGGISIIGYNHNTLEKVDIFQDNSANIDKYDDIEDFNYSIKRDFNQENHTTELITREEFISLASEFTNRYNNLIKEL